MLDFLLFPLLYTLAQFFKFLFPNASGRAPKHYIQCFDICTYILISILREVAGGNDFEEENDAHNSVEEK